MGFHQGLFLRAGLLAFATQTLAQVASVCPSTNVCFKLNIPETTSQSGSGDIFFQISSPSSYEYIALAQGTRMSNANMFIVYTSSSGTNVTLSPRTATGHNMPTYNSNARVELLEGSGVQNGIMTANVKCSNCNSWSSGSADFTASSGSWIYAYQTSNGPKNSNDQSATIRQHSKYEVFNWDYSAAKGGSSVNPLLNSSPSGTGASGSAATATSCIQRSATGAGQATASATGSTRTASVASATTVSNTQSSYTRFTAGGSYATSRPTSRPWNAEADKRFVARQNLPYCDELNNSNSNGNSNTGFTSVNSSGSGNQSRMLIAHAVLASLAFVILFPAGAIAIRLASFPGIVWFHAAFQVVAYLVYIAGAGLGIYLATEQSLLTCYHPIIGLTVLAALFLQPILGFLHHHLFKKYSTRTLWSYAHIWLGRSAITLGIINGGLGLNWAYHIHTSPHSATIAYGVVAAVVWLAWVAAMIIGEWRRKARSVPPKYAESPTGSPRAALNASEISHPENGHFAPKAQA